MSEAELHENRCIQHCGSNKSCLAENRNHLNCVVDMVLNKAWGTREILLMASKENECPKVGDVLDMAAEELNLLIEWVRALRGHRKSTRTRVSLIETQNNIKTAAAVEFSTNN